MPGLHRLIYPNWNPNAIVCGKPSSLTFSDRDSWMFDSQAPDLGQQWYTRGLLWMRQQVKKHDPNLWWEFKYDPKVIPYKGGIVNFKNSYRMGSVAPAQLC
jgi:hypothetical protein